MKKRKENGFMSIEAIGAVIISIFSLVLGAEIYNTWLDNLEFNTAAHHLLEVEKGAKNYINDHYNDLISATSSMPVAEVTVKKLKIKNYLPDYFSETNSFGQTYTIRVKKAPSVNSKTQLQAIILTSSGDEISEYGVRKIANMIGAHGGYFAEESGARVIQGALGAWSEKANAFGLDPGNGHLAAALFFIDGKSASNDFLYRKTVPGKPELNQMQTALDMGDQDLVNAKDIHAKGNITAKSILATEKIEADSIHSKKRLSTGEFLQVDGPAHEGGPCTGKLIGIASNGTLLSCQSGKWRKISNPTLDVFTKEGPKVCGHWAESSVTCPTGYLLAGGGHTTSNWWRGETYMPHSLPIDKHTWFIRLPHNAGFCATVKINCIKINP